MQAAPSASSWHRQLRPRPFPSSALTRPGPARPCKASGTARKLIPGLRSCPRASPPATEQATERRAARGPRRAEDPPLGTLGNVVQLRLAGGRCLAAEAGSTWAWGLVEPHEPRAYWGRKAPPVKPAGELQSSSPGLCDSQGAGGWRWESQAGGKGVCVCVCVGRRMGVGVGRTGHISALLRLHPRSQEAAR